jgi:hypothetical protein
MNVEAGLEARVAEAEETVKQAEQRLADENARIGVLEQQLQVDEHRATSPPCALLTAASLGGAMDCQAVEEAACGCSDKSDTGARERCAASDAVGGPTD